jgi:hypothetical protein
VRRVEVDVLRLCEVKYSTLVQPVGGSTAGR